MDLEIEDIAQILNVKTQAVQRWVEEDKIPGYKLDNKYRFSRLEIEKWLLNCKTSSSCEIQLPFSKKKIRFSQEKANKFIGNQIGTQAYSLYRAMSKGGLIEGIDGDTKHEVIKQAVEKIAPIFAVDEKIIFDLLIDRENLMPTSLNHGIAVPHARDFILKTPYDVVCTVFLNKPIEWGALDGKKVHTIFFLFSCDDKKHLHLLSKLAHLTRQDNMLDFFMQKPNQNEFLDSVRNWEANILKALIKSF